MDHIFFFGIGKACWLDQVDFLAQDVFAQEVLQDDENGLIQRFVVAQDLVVFEVNYDVLFLASFVWVQGCEYGIGLF